MSFYFINILFFRFYSSVFLLVDKCLTEFIRNFAHVAESIYEILGSDG